MDGTDRPQIGGLAPELSNSSEPPRRISRLLLLWPLAGLVSTLFAIIKYPPLDDTLVYWIGAAPCLIGYVIINVAWRRAKEGSNVHSSFPPTIWLAVGCLFVPLTLLLNGALDRSPVEQHRQIIMRTILEHGRRGSTSYYVQCSSWRGRSEEKLTVSLREFLQCSPGDPFIVETRRGALSIPLLVSAHRP